MIKVNVFKKGNAFSHVRGLHRTDTHPERTVVTAASKTDDRDDDSRISEDSPVPRQATEKLSNKKTPERRTV